MASFRLAEINGQPGALFLDREERVVLVISVDIADDLVQTVRALSNPEKLRSPAARHQLVSRRESQGAEGAVTKALPVKDGFVAFAGYRTWYRLVGEGEEDGKLPLLCLHGGPGATWHHMEPYEALAEGRRVIFYDQLGCGNSAVTERHETSMWTPELYVEEVQAVRGALGLERVHVFGHSWGGMLGMLYAIGQPAGLASLIVESSPANVPEWMKEVNRLRGELPPEVQATLLEHEEAGTTDSPEYEEAMMVFYRRHVCRTDPWPDFVNRTFEGLLANPEVYYTMNGPSEFHVIGPLKDFDISGDLDKIIVPTLLFSGRYDEVTPTTMERVHEGIPGSELVVFEESSHMSQGEEPEKVLGLVRRFLSRVERTPR